MMEEKIISLLKITEPFHLLPETVLAEISETLIKTEFSKDTLAYRQEVTEMKGVDIISSGEYETFFFDAAGNKRCITRHHSPYCFGGISVVLNRVRALKSAIAKKGTVVYTLPRKEFYELCDAYEDFFSLFHFRFW